MNNKLENEKNIELNPNIQLDDEFFKTVEHDNLQEMNSFDLFLYSLRSPFTKESYTRRLKKFFETIGIRGEIGECCDYIVKKGQTFINYI